MNEDRKRKYLLTGQCRQGGSSRASDDFSMKIVHKMMAMGQGDTYLISGVAIIYTHLASREHLLENNGFTTLTKNNDEQISFFPQTTPSPFLAPNTCDGPSRTLFLLFFFYIHAIPFSESDCYPS